MANNKVIGPQPKASVYGDNPGGKVGNTKGGTSSGGGKQGHLPSAGSYSGRKGGNTNSGTTGQTTTTDNPVLPKGNPHGGKL